ncbi:MAG: MFS transporter [Phenylobacterium sp.]|uniref:MFS transporter n=1 Tax=Phenylobacterium sp. TaxID=1871053 RepID=UPI0039197380
MSADRFSKARIVLVLGVGQIFAFGSSFYLLGVLGDPIARDLGLPPAFVFSLMSAALLMSGLLARRAGRWIQTYGGKPVLLASNLVFAGGFVLMAISPGAVGLVAGMLVVGAAMAFGMYETPFAILVGLYGEGARRPITGVALLGGLGSTIGWPTTLAFEQAFGWRGACLAWAAVHIGLCLPMALAFVPQARPGRTARSAAVAVAWDRPMVQLAALFAATWFVSTCMSAHLPRLLQAFGLAPAAAVGAASLVGVAAVSMRLAEFTVFRKFDPLLTARAGTLMHPLGAAALAAGGPTAGAALALGQGAGNGLLTVAKGVLPLSLYGSENYALRSAMLSAPARYLQAAGPALYGLVLDRSAGAALLASSALCLFMFAMTFGLAPRSAHIPETAR